MPARRLDRMKRLAAVQEQMRRAAEWDLATLRSCASTVEADRAALLAAMAEPPPGRSLLEAASRRLRALAAESSSLVQSIDAGTQAVREHGLARKRSEAGIARLGEAQRGEGDRRAILDALDDLAARRGVDASDASLP